MNITQLSISLASAVANGIALNQTTGGAGNLTLNGSLVSGGVATLDVPRRVSAFSTANLSGVTFTVTGTDRFGNPQVGTFVGPNNATVYTAQDFATVSRVSVSGAVGTNVEVGTTGIASTPWYCGDWRHLGAIIVGISLSAGASLTYTVEFTMTDLSGADLYPNVAAVITNFQNPIVFPSTDSTVVAASTNEVTNFLNTPVGIRVTLNSYSSGTLTAQFMPTNTKTS